MEMLSRISKLMPQHRFKIMINGIFNSKLSYCLCLFGSISGLDTMQDGDTRHCSFTQASLRALQTIQNKLLRLLTCHGYETPILQLLEEAEMLSVNQQIAYSTMTTLFKIKQNKEPS